MIKKIPKSVVDIMTLINNQNKQSYIIGGAVRDFIIGQTPHDYDITTNIPLFAIKEQIPEFHLMKQTERRNTGIIRTQQTIIEISTYKGETLEEDILKRDFTINGIAMDVEGNIIDPYNFQQDITNKKISLIDKTGASIAENPLLILRAIRFACTFGFEIDDNTKQLMHKHRVNIAKIIGQRIYLELSKILTTNLFPKYLDEYFNIFIMIIPELININFSDRNKLYNLLSITPNNIILKLASLFSYCNNPQQNFTQFANRMMIDKKTTKLVSLLLSYKEQEIDTSKNGINRTIHEFNIHNVDLLFAYKKLLMTQNGQNTDELSIAQQKYQTAVDQIIQSKISNLQINLDRLVQMGYTKEESTIIFEDIKGRVITNSLQNNENSINSYILKNYKRS